MQFSKVRKGYMSDRKKEQAVERALTEGYEKYYRLAYSYVHNEADALDIVQEAAYKAILKSDSLKEPQYVETWVYRIVINEACSFLRSRKESVDVEEIQAASEDIYENIDLKRAIENLDPKDRAIVVLRFFEDRQLEEIAKTYPTPFYLYDEKGIRENALKLKEAFSWNKGFREYFAVKATPNPFILKILQELGCGTDCSSKTELLMSDACGFSGHDIMFSSNDTPLEEFKLAYDLGAIINLDDFTHIECLEKTIGTIPETICCRFNPGGLFKVATDIMDNPGDAKYGMTEAQITEAYKILKAKGAELGITEPFQMFWATGFLSSFLDNTPTYLVFLTTAGSLGFTEGMQTILGTVPVAMLEAISCGAVFMGANTYIGNAPNFMVKAISDENGIKMPSFFGYLMWSIAFLVPVFLLDMLVFFL